MCLNPKTFLNPTHYFEFGRSFLNIPVSCGSCLECQNVSRNEWFFRNYAEWKYTIENGGCAFFLTLTYAEENLPYFFQRYKYLESDGSISEKLTSFPCFSLEDIQVFISNMRKYACRRFGKDTRIRYEVFPEYGSKTQRPHYHCLFYVNKMLTNKQFLQLVDGYDNDIIRRKCYRWNKDIPFFKTKSSPYGAHQRGAWTHGLIIISKKSKGGMRINNEKSIKYCSKYAVKDINYLKLPYVDEFLSCVNDSRLYDAAERKKVISRFNKHTCMHRQSCKLGYVWLMNKLFTNPEHYLTKGFTLDIDCNRTQAQSYFLPLYYRRKLFNKYTVLYNLDGKKHIHWYHRYSTRSKQLFDLEGKINNFVKSYSEQVHNLLGRRFGNFELDKIGRFGSFMEMFMYISSFLSSVTLRQLAIYKFVFFNRSARYDVLSGVDYRELCSYTFSDFLDSYQDYYMNFIDNRHSPNFGESYLKLPQVQHTFKFAYNTLPCFSGFDEVLEVLQRIRSIFDEGKLEYNAYKNTYVHRMSDNNMNFSYADFMEFSI